MILRQLRDGPIRVIPFMRIDGKRVVPRLEFTINLVAALLPAVAEPLRQAAGDEAATEPVAMLKRTLLVSAFDEPQLVKHTRVIVGRRLEGKTYKEIAKELEHGELRRHHAVDGRRGASRAVPPIDGKARPRAASSTGCRRANARAAAGAAERHDIRDSGTQPKASASVARFHGRRRLADSGRPRRWPRDRVQTFPRCVVESRECLRSSCRDQEISVSSFSNSSGVQMIGLASPALSSTSKTLGRIRAFAICVQFHVNK